MIYSINGTRQPGTWWLKNHPPRRDRFCLVEREGCIDRAWNAFTAAVSDYLGPYVRIRSGKPIGTLREVRTGRIHRRRSDRFLPIIYTLACNLRLKYNETHTRKNTHTALMIPNDMIILLI